MIQNRSAVKEVNGNINGTVIGMTIDEGAMQHIMNVLTDLYKDPEAAVLREYSTNGWDAQVEAGITRPIEVTLPNALNPVLRIRDFGVGLSVQDIHDIYSKYGASTKRSTNGQVGMLGLGCKSALTYADQFTVTSVQNGVRVQVAVARSASGSAAMTVIETTTTDDANGTEIMVPAKRHNEFERKARHFFSFWEPGSVLVNGEAPKHFTEYDALKVTDDMHIVHGNTSYIVMGNVAYPWENPKHGLSWQEAVVARVGIGEVSFPPSREGLMYEDEVTNPTLERVIADFRKALPDALNAAIQGATTFQEALRLKLRWANTVSRVGIPAPKWTYNGVVLPAELCTQGGTKVGLVDRNASRLSAIMMIERVRLDWLEGAVFIENWDRPNFTAGQKKKIQSYFFSTVARTDVRRYVLLPGKIPADWRRWIAKEDIYDWAPIQAVKLNTNRATGSPGKIPGSFDITTRSGNSYNKPGDDVAKLPGPMYYLHGNLSEGSSYGILLREGGKDFTLVCLPANRLDKFRRTFPKAKCVKAHVTERYKSWWKTVTPEQRRALAMRQTTYRSAVSALTNILPDRVDDPDIKAAIKAAKTDVDALSKRYTTFSYVLTRGALEVPKAAPDGFTKYRLLGVDDFRLYTDHEPLYRYLNMEYAWLKANGKV